MSCQQTILIMRTRLGKQLVRGIRVWVRTIEVEGLRRALRGKGGLEYHCRGHSGHLGLQNLVAVELVTTVATMAEDQILAVMTIGNFDQKDEKI